MVRENNRRDLLFVPFQIFELNYSTISHSSPINSTNFVHPVAETIIDEFKLNESYQVLTNLVKHVMVSTRLVLLKWSRKNPWSSKLRQSPVIKILP